MNTKITVVNHNKVPESLSTIDFKLSTNNFVHYKYKVITEDPILCKSYSYVFSVSKEHIVDTSITRVVKFAQNTDEKVKCEKIQEYDRGESFRWIYHETTYNKVDDLFVNFYKTDDWQICYTHFIDEVSHLIKALATTKSGRVLSTWNLSYNDDTITSKTPMDIIAPVHKLMPELPTRMYFELVPSSYNRGFGRVDKLIEVVKKALHKDDLKVVVFQSSNHCDARAQVIFYDLIMPNLQFCKDFASNFDLDVPTIDLDVYSPNSYLSQLGLSSRNMQPLVTYNTTGIQSFKHLCMQPEIRPEYNLFYVNEHAKNIKSECSEFAKKIPMWLGYTTGLYLTKKYNDDVNLCSLNKTCPLCKKQQDNHNFIVKHIVIDCYETRHITYSLGCMKMKKEYNLVNFNSITISHNDLKAAGIELPTLVKVDKKTAKIAELIVEKNLVSVESLANNNQIGAACKKKLIKLRYASNILKELSQLEDVGVGSESFNTLRNYDGYNNITLDQLQQAFVNLYTSEKINDPDFKKLVYKNAQLSKLPKENPSQYNWTKMINLLKHLFNDDTYNLRVETNKLYKGKAIESICLVRNI